MSKTAPPPLFDAVVPSTNDEVRTVLIRIRAMLADIGLSIEEVGSIELVLAEALNNIVEHAYAGGSGPIDIELTAAPNGICVRLEDKGFALPDERMPLGSTVGCATATDDLPEGGFGWFLIRQLAHDLEYRREAGTNILTFRFAVAVPEPV